MVHVPAGFAPPDLSRPIDLAAQLALVPPGATVKGMHLQALVDHCAEQGRPLKAARYHAFRDYPGEDLLHLLVEATTRCFPAAPPREGLRRLGRLAYPALARSTIGRVVFGLVGSEPRALVSLVSKGYAISGSAGQASVLSSDDHSAILRLEGMYSFVDAWHVGIVEGAAKAIGREFTVQVRLRSPTAADLLVRW